MATVDKYDSPAAVAAAMAEYDDMFGAPRWVEGYCSTTHKTYRFQVRGLCGPKDRPAPADPEAAMVEERLPYTPPGRRLATVMPRTYDLAARITAALEQATQPLTCVDIASVLGEGVARIQDFMRFHHKRFGIVGLPGMHHKTYCLPQGVE